MNQTQQHNPAPKKTASQRLDQAENALGSLYNAVNTLARDNETIKEALRLLGNKSDAIVKLISRGEDLSDEAISQVMIENNIEELKGRIDQLKERGVLTAEDAVQELSFVVGRELDEEGKIINPRLQFALKAMPEATQKAIIGAKLGDVVTVAEGKSKFEVLETYKINQPKTVEAVEAAAEEAVLDSATEAKADEAKTEAPQSNA